MTKNRLPNNAKYDSDMWQRTLDMLILQTLLLGPAHGHAIANAMEHGSSEILQVEHGSSRPPLYRLEDRGWLVSFRGTSENNRILRAATD